METLSSQFSRRRFLATVAGALASASVLAACAPAAAPTAAPAAPAKATEAPKAEAPKPTAAAASKPSTGTGTLVIWGQQSFTPEGDKKLGDQMQEFGKAKGIAVEYVLVENKTVNQKLAAAIEAKATSDVQMLGSADGVQYYASRNLLADLTDVWGKTSTKAGGFFESVLEVYKSGGKYLGIPFETHSFPLFTRLDLMEQATGKKDPPKTLDELYEAAKKITKAPSMYALGMCLGRIADTADGTIQLLWCDGAAHVTKDMKPAIKSEGTLSVLKRYQQWWKEKLIPPDAVSWDDTGNNNAYQSKQVAFVINPPSPYDWMQKNDKELLNNTTMAAMPAGKAGSFAISGSWSWSIFNLSKNIDQGKAMIEYLMEPDRLEDVYEQIGGRWYPVHKDLKNKPYWASKPHFQYYPDMIANGRYYAYPALPEPKLMEAIGEIGQRYVIPDMVQAVIVSGKSPEQAMDEAAKSYDEIFKKYGVGQ